MSLPWLPKRIKLDLFGCSFMGSVAVVAVSVDVVAISVDVVAISVDVVAISVDVVAISVDVVAISVTVVAISVDVVAISVDVVAIVVSFNVGVLCDKLVGANETCDEGVGGDEGEVSVEGVVRRMRVLFGVTMRVFGGCMPVFVVGFVVFFVVEACRDVDESGMREW